MTEERPPIPQDILDGAQNGRDWFDAYLTVGFTEEQAIQLVCRTIVSTNYTMSPEMEQAMSKLSMLFDRSLAEDV